MPRGLAGIVCVFALVDKTLGQTPRQLPRRLIYVVLVIAAVLAGEQNVQHVVAVVVPLRVNVSLEM